MIENPRTGERIEFVSETEGLLVMHSTWTRPGHRASEHVHPKMEETFHVLEGRARIRAGGEEREIGPGESFVVPRATAHLAWNPTGDLVRLRLEMRPALRWREFTERLFGGEEPMALLGEFPDEIAPQANRG